MQCEVLGKEVPVVFRTFLNTITKIFDLPTWFQTISSTASDTGHAPRTVAALILVGSLLRRRSLEQLEGWSRQRETLERTVQDLLRHKNLTDIVQYHLMSRSIARGRTTVQSWQIAWSLDSAALRAAQRLFGVTCFQTNAPAAALSTSDIIAWYRRKNRVEEAFHEIKSPLALRPLFVTRAQRIRAHVMACVLVYDLYNTMEERLRLHDQAESPPTVLKALASSQINRLRVKSTDQTRLTITEPTPLQRTYVSALQCDAVLEDRTIQSIVTAMKSWL